MAEQQPVEVEVFGQRFTLTSDKSADELQRIAAYVNAHLQRIMAGQSRASVVRITLMAALTIADEYHSAMGHLELPHGG